MVKREVTEEGEIIPYHLESMDFGTEIDGTEDFFQMFWPIIVSHKIDSDSPLWEISARDLTSKMQFEIVLTMEGITPETGNTIQVMSDIFYQSCFIHTHTHTHKGKPWICRMSVSALRWVLV